MKKKRKSKKQLSSIYSIALRYLTLLVSSLGNLWIFYFIFSPLTVYSSYFILSLLYDSVSLTGNIIFIGGVNSPIEIVGACVAGAAYFLLFILNLSVPEIKLSKRFKMLLFAFSSFFIINIIRIVSLSAIFIADRSIFEITHKITWYIGSIVFVVGIWFLEVKLFKIKEIPFYSDIKTVIKDIKQSNKK